MVKGLFHVNAYKFQDLEDALSRFHVFGIKRHIRRSKKQN